VLELLEDLEDDEELRRARQEKDQLIPWERVQADYKRVKHRREAYR
jgi:hypothetical protein